MHRQDIPDIEVIDLENGSNANNTFPKESASPDSVIRDTADVPGKKKFPVNIHIVLVIVVVVTFAVILYKYLNWGQHVDPAKDFSGADDYMAENYDNILPLTDSEDNILAPNLEDGLSIVIFGNGPFAEDRDSEDGLAAMLAEATGATVYNCAVGGSYLASAEPSVPDMYGNPWDAFSFYWMSCYSTDMEVHDFFGVALEFMGADVPLKAAEVHDIFSTLDFDTVDIIVIMYDATDYFMGHPAGSTEGFSAIQSFAGNLEVGLKVLQEHHPNTRIIVMSPTYAFSDQTDENGDYLSSDIIRYGEDALSTYVSKSAEICSALQVTYVDNFYVTFNEDNATDYLRDNAHLNSAGREKVIERLVYALNYFNIFYE